MTCEPLLSPLFTTLAATGDDGILVCDGDGRVLFASPGRAFAAAPVAAGDHIDRLGLPATPAAIALLDTGVLCPVAGQPCDIRVHAVDLGGGVRHHLLRLRPVVADSDWQDWLESLPVPVSLRDAEGCFVWANQRFTRQFAPAGSCVVGKPVSDVLCPEDAQKTLEADRYALAMDQGVIFEYICSDRFCATGHYMVMQCPCTLPDGTRAVFSVAEEMERLRTDMPSFQETEIRYRRLARHLLTYLDNHHASLARELHDVLGQTLIGLKLAIHNRLGNRDLTQGLGEAMQYWMVLLDECIDFVRNFSGSLHPRHLQEFGLKRALRAWLQQIANHSALDMRVRIDEALPALTPEIKHACLRIAQEAVTNCLRHAKASRLEVTLEHNDGLMTLTVRDNGRGFCPQESREHDAGLGTISMRERAYLSGGKLNIASAPGEGTTITAIWPLA
ncbi:PAS domain-containing protein [Fluviicoccus keumensis]|uniref:PAS domain-containing protein n=1 Tax=Fluviicoccus keumensis TaxID=1435465 RepID=A0A4Q7YP30_9GAMM|nr:ATP-binding protein [Fluviicoccus keumensis]RZU38445.1 PAS domain-containing protein [Fluviicoccus keumensis]